MSWSIKIIDKDGNDLLKKYGVPVDLLHVAPDENSDMPYSLSFIRAVIDSQLYKDRFSERARGALKDAQRMVRANVNSLTHRHCETCSCPNMEPNGWDISAALKFLVLPASEVHRIESGSE